nr:MAG TPA: hypothetical protein [Caudoviricetes sp.]
MQISSNKFRFFPRNILNCGGQPRKVERYNKT